jgi:hypothetical protein
MWSELLAPEQPSKSFILGAVASSEALEALSMQPIHLQ